MKNKIIILKSCDNSVYGADNEKNIFIVQGKGEPASEDYESHIIIKNIDWSYDFCFIDNVLYYIKDRKIFNEKGEKVLDSDFPVKIKSKHDKIYVLEQEQSSLKIYDKNFNFIKSIGKLGIDKFEEHDQTFFHFPVDFDVFEDKTGVIDPGNRRTVILDKEKKLVFPIIGKKLVFFNKELVLVLYGETIYKIDLRNNKISKTEYEGIIDFCVEPYTKNLIILKE